MPEVKVQVAPLAVGEAEERAVGVRRARRMLAVGERGVAFGRIVESGRVVPPKRVHQLNLHRLAGDEVEGVVVIALGGIPVGRLAAGLQLQLAVVVLHRLRVVAGVLALVLIDAQLVGERPARQAGDGDADVARMDGAGQRRGVGDLNRVRQPLRRQDVAGGGIGLAVVRDEERHAGRQVDGIVGHAQEADVQLRDVVDDLAEVDVDRHALRAGEADPVGFIEALARFAVGEHPARVQIGVGRRARKGVGQALRQIDPLQRAVDLAGIERVDGGHRLLVHEHLPRLLGRRGRVRRDAGRIGNAVLRVAAGGECQHRKRHQQRGNTFEILHEKSTNSFLVPLLTVSPAR